MYTFRESTLGVCLKDAVEEMRQDDLIPSHLADKILHQFDKSVARAFEEKVKAKGSLKGDCIDYKYVDSVWQFFVKNPKITVGNESISCETIKIIATDIKVATEQK